MKALVYPVPDATRGTTSTMPELLAPDDAIVRVDAVTICGTDLHILKGDVADVEAGRVLGHEAVGTVQQVGAGVRNIAVGDRVLISCISPAVAAGSAGPRPTVSASTAAAGSWATWWTAPRPSTSGCRSPTTASTRCRTR